MSNGNRIKHTFRLPPDLSRQLAEYAGRKRVSQASVVEAAVASFLSPDGSERMEAAFSRRLDRVSRQLDTLDYHVEIGNEAIALFVRFWLGANPSISDLVTEEAKASAELRFQNFIEALSHRVEKGRRISIELRRK